jgi:hypothetical protein
MPFLLRVLFIGGYALVLEVIAYRCIFRTRSIQQWLLRYCEDHKAHPLSRFGPSLKYVNSNAYIYNTRFAGFIAFVMGLIVFLTLFAEPKE